MIHNSQNDLKTFGKSKTIEKRLEISFKAELKTFDLNEKQLKTVVKN